MILCVLLVLFTVGVWLLISVDQAYHQTLSIAAKYQAQTGIAYTDDHLLHLFVEILLLEAILFTIWMLLINLGGKNLKKLWNWTRRNRRR